MMTERHKNQDTTSNNITLSKPKAGIVSIMESNNNMLLKPNKSTPKITEFKYDSTVVLAEDILALVVLFSITNIILH